jgi:outer membrane protein assembly factor BamB
MGQSSKALRRYLSLFFCLTLISCGGGSKPAALEADFSLTATPAVVTLVPAGTGQQVSVNTTPTNGFTGAITVAITGLPTGVTAQPATLTLTPGTAQIVTLTAAATATPGNVTVIFVGTSGTLSHSATVTATIATPPPPPDFTLTTSPTSLTLTAGAVGSQVSVTATAINSFSGTVAVAITGLPSGVTANPSTLTLTPGTAQSITLTAAITAAAAASTITFTGTSAGLVHSAPLSLTVQAAPTTNAPDVTTYHYDLARDGLNAQETILTQSNVNSTQFGKIGFFPVDSKVDAEPLYLANVVIGNQLHNILYVATEHDSVYAFDADTGAQIWKTSILASGETTSDDHGCSQITPEIGITSTPVIDRKQGANGTLFTIGMTKDANGKYHQRLHALDLTTGAEISGSPTEITASYPGQGDNSQNGNVVFDPSQYAERAALLLLNGNIYTGWTSHCDQGLYTGWVIGYSESTLQQTQLLNLTPNGHEGSIWMSGDGMAADSAGNIYLLDANGIFDTTFDINGFPTKGDYGNAMVKLSTNGKLAVADYFETFNTNDESADDLDLGSGGELLLPDQTDATGHVFHLIVGAGKDRNIYLADRDNMGKFNFANMPMDDSNIYQELPNAMSGLVYSTPAYFNGVLYYAADGDNLKAFPLTAAKLAATPSSVSAVKFPHPGPTPSVSANGTQNGIVWALESSLTAPGVLHAYDPANLAHELYNSNQATNGRDSFGNGNKFITPMIVNGKVYVGTQNGVAVFGLLSH